MNKTELYKRLAKIREEAEQNKENKAYYKGLFLGIIETAWKCEVISETEYNELLDSPINY